MTILKKERSLNAKILKLAVTVVVTLLSVVLASALLVLFTPAVQTWLAHRASAYLSNKLKSEIRVQHIALRSLNRLTIEGLLVKDQRKDTLLYAAYISTRFNPTSIFKSNIDIKAIQIDTLTAKLYDTANDSVFNYQYIADFFGSSKQPKTTAKTDAIGFSVGAIRINSVRFLYHNHHKGNQMVVNFKSLNVDKSAAGLDSSRFNVERLSIEKLTYISQSANDSMLVFVDSFSTISNLINLKSYNSSLGDISANGLKVGYSSESPPMPKPSSTAKQSTNQPWTISIKSIHLTNSSAAYNNSYYKKKQPAEFDPNHLSISDFNLLFSEIAYTPSYWNLNIKDLNFKEKSKLALKSLAAKINLKDGTLNINPFRIATNNSTLRLVTKLENFNPHSPLKDADHLKVDAIIDTLKVGFADMLLFAPTIKKSPKEFINKGILLHSKITGSLSNLKVQQFKGTAGSSSIINLQASIKGLPAVQKLTYTVPYLSIKSSATDIEDLTKGILDLGHFSIPQKLEVTANGEGSTNSFKGLVILTSSDGDLQLSTDLQNIDNQQKASYNLTFESNALHIGKIVRMDSTLGHVAFYGTLQGKGLSVESADAQLGVSIPYVDILKYRYHLAELRGTISERKLYYQVETKDTNLVVDLRGDAFINGKSSGINSRLSLKKINLQPLGFSSQPLSIKTNLSASFSSINIDSLIGKLATDSLLISNGKSTVKIDTLQLVASLKDSIKSIEFTSDNILAKLEGNYQLASMGEAFTHTLSGYAPYFIKNSTAPTSSQKFNFSLLVKGIGHLKEIIPDLTTLDPIRLNAEINTDSQRVLMNGEIPHITYGASDLRGGKLSVNLQNGDGDIHLSADKIATQALNIYTPAVGLIKSDKNLNFSLSTMDSLNILPLYQVETNLKIDSTSIESHLAPSLTLNGDFWSVSPKNRIRVAREGLLIEDMSIASKEQSLSIASTQPIEGSPVRVKFSNLDLKTFTNIAGLDTSFIGGVLNGLVTINQLKPTPIVTSNLAINNLLFNRISLGTLSVEAQNLNKGRIETKVSLKGEKNDLTLGAFYNIDKPNDIGGKLQIDNLNISMLSAFSKDLIANPKGTINGNATITGNLKNPKIDGSLHFLSTSLTFVPTNSFLKLQNETISISNRGIGFRNFSLLDSAGNKFTIDGDVLTSTFRDYHFSLNLRSTNFEIIRKQENLKSLLYGPVWINTNAKIEGSSDLPRIKATTAILPKSKITVILPESGSGINGRDGIVEFGDSLAINKPVVLRFNESDSLARSNIKGVELNANISIDKDAQLTLKLSPQDGDMLTVQGEANLNASVDPSGKFSLAGRYLISKGMYALNFSGLMQRKFEISEGSSINWKGAPTDANVNITAAYKIKAAPIDLVSNKLSGMDPTLVNQLKQKQEFIVYLNMKGELMKPEISFSVDMPSESQNALDGQVYALVQELNKSESEQKKQVSALLVLGRFVASNPFSSLASSSSQSAIRENASRILSSQLNALTDNLIQGVDFDFNLESKEDYSTGEAKNQTNLNVGVSRQIGDRVSVYVGSNFALENADPNASKNNIAGDVSVVYKLTRDGRYRIKIFRKNQYEAILAGEVVETGATFNLIVDYDRLKELFQKSGRQPKQ